MESRTVIFIDRYTNKISLLMNKRAIFAFDFSMNKPAMCCLVKNEISFYTWPTHVDEFTYDALSKCNVNVINRGLPPIKDKSLNEHELICEHVTRAVNLAGMIVNTVLEILEKNHITVYDVIISNEGFAFAAKGDAALDLSGYKYILMHAFMSKGFTDFRTYSPITIKATAGCAKKGSKKEDMITKLGEENNDLHLFIHTIYRHPEMLKKKTAYVNCVDDLADAYWCLKTTVKKENISCILSD